MSANNRKPNTTTATAGPKSTEELIRIAREKAVARQQATRAQATQATAEKALVRNTALELIRAIDPGAPTELTVEVMPGVIVTMKPHIWSTGTVGYMASGQKVESPDGARYQANFNLYLSNK